MNISTISRKKKELEARVTADGYQTTARDVAEAAELVNQYIDELERLENTAVPSNTSNIEPVVKSILKRWYPND